MGRTVYLASSFSLKRRVERTCQMLTEHGHEVPDQWWRRDLKEEYAEMDDDEWYEHPEVIGIAEKHWRSIEEADTFVLVCPITEPKKFNGGNVELGFAHAHGLDIYSVGKLERSAMYEPVTRCTNVHDLVENLE